MTLLFLLERQDIMYLLLYFDDESAGNSKMASFYLKSYKKWPVAVKSFRVHVITKSDINSGSEHFFYRFLDKYKSREIVKKHSVNKIVESNCNTNLKNFIEVIAPILNIAVKLGVL